MNQFNRTDAAKELLRDYLEGEIDLEKAEYGLHTLGLTEQEEPEIYKLHMEMDIMVGTVEAMSIDQRKMREASMKARITRYFAGLS